MLSIGGNGRTVAVDTRYRQCRWHGGGKHDLTKLGGSLNLCDYCHGRSAAPSRGVAQWSRTDNDVSFRPYSGPTMDATMIQPGDESRLCLSCHDLSDDHPVGVATAIDSGEIKYRSVIEAAGVTLYDGKVECSSCHDVHGRSGFKRFLRVGPKLLCLSCHNK